MRTMRLAVVLGVGLWALGLGVAGAGEEPELITDAEIAELRVLAEQARAGTLPGMMPKAEIDRLRAALKVNPKTPAEARLQEYRMKMLAVWDQAYIGSGGTASRLRPGARSAVSPKEFAGLKQRMDKRLKDLAAAKLHLDIAEGRVTRQATEAEIQAAQAEIAGLDANLAAVAKESESALNPERYRQEQTAKLQPLLDAAGAKLAAGQARLATIQEVLGEDF